MSWVRRVLALVGLVGWVGSVASCESVPIFVMGGGGSAGCVPVTCESLGATCGVAGDGCGHTLQCGGCPAGQFCGGNGVANQCGSADCTALTCSDLVAECGAISDGCGGVLACGTCPTGQSCGAGGPNTCGGGACVPKTCGSL